MTPAIIGLTLAGWSEVSTPFKPSVSHIMARFVGAAAVVVYFTAAALSSGAPLG